MGEGGVGFFSTLAFGVLMSYNREYGKQTGLL